MESKDCITLSDGEDNEDIDDGSINDVSVQVIGEINNSDKSSIPKLRQADSMETSIIDLTEGNNDTLRLLSPSPECKLDGRATSLTIEDRQQNIDQRSDSPPLIPPATPSSSPSPVPTDLILSSSPSSSAGNRRSSRNSSIKASPSKDSRQSTESDSKKASPKLSKSDREQAKRQKVLEKEDKRLQSEANRANAANKALQNCAAILDKNLLTIIEDQDEINIRTLFDESMLNYRTTTNPKYDNCITWNYRRTEVEGRQCVVRHRDSDWILIVMEGSDYLKRIMLHRTDPKNPASLANFICDIRRRTQSDMIILVYNLANYLKNERQKDARNYRKTFKDRFEGPNSGSRTTSGTANHNNSDGTHNISTTDLLDLRLMFEIQVKYDNPDWKLHFEFCEKTQEAIQCIARYSTSIAKHENKRRVNSETNLDWAINMDKEKAIDPTKSAEDLNKLWITQLQQFSQITLPIAKAIALEYPSPGALLDQYKNLTMDEAENLLAEIHIQRNYQRKVGPNISRRIHCFMTSQDPDIHIGYG